MQEHKSLPTLWMVCFSFGALWLGGMTGLPTKAWSASKNPTKNLYSPYMQRIRAQLQRKPKSPRLHTILGRLQQRAGQWKLAEASYRQALRYSKSYSHALVGLAHLALREGKAKEAGSYLRKVLRKNPRHASALAKQSEWYRWKATRAKKKKKRQVLLQRAIKVLQKALVLRPRSHRYRYRLALLHMARHQHFQAHQQFVLAVSLQRLLPCYHVGASMSAAMLTRKDNAYKKLKQWLPRCRHPLMSQMAERVWMTHQIQKAQQLLSQGQGKMAILNLKKSILLAPNAPSGYLYLTLLLSQEQKCWEARQTLTQLLKRFPNHTEAKKLLSQSRALRCSTKPRSRARTRVQLLKITPRSSVPQPSSPPVRKTKP